MENFITTSVSLWLFCIHSNSRNPSGKSLKNIPGTCLTSLDIHPTEIPKPADDFIDLPEALHFRRVRLDLESMFFRRSGGKWIFQQRGCRSDKGPNFRMVWERIYCRFHVGFVIRQLSGGSEKFKRLHILWSFVVHSS